MRTDVKVGIAIGLVVVGLVVVYFAMDGFGDKKTDTAVKPAPGTTPKPGTTVRPSPPVSPPPSPFGDRRQGPTSIPSGPGMSASTTGPSVYIQPTTGPSLIVPPGPGTSRTTLVPPLAGAAKTYAVVGNDTLWGIAVKEYGDGKYADLIRTANPSVNPARLRVGTKLTLPPKPASATPITGPGITGRTGGSTGPVAGPGQRVHTVASGETGWSIAEKEYNNGAYWPIISKANKGLDAGRLRIGQKIVLPSKAEAEAALSGARIPTSPARAPGAVTPPAVRPSTPSSPTAPAPDGRPHFHIPA